MIPEDCVVIKHSKTKELKLFEGVLSATLWINDNPLWSLKQ